MTNLIDPLITPIAIGGVGGSGTRVIAGLLQEIGIDIGNDLNESNDNLVFTLLFKRTELWPVENHTDEINRCLRLFLNASLSHTAWTDEDIRYIHSLAVTDRPQHSREWLQERAEKLIEQSPNGPKQSLWGWKEPNTHILLPSLVKQLPKMKYIHVMRHGLDMAYSSNQNQLHLWGSLFLSEQHLELTAENSFRYWCAAHRRIQIIGKNMGDNFLLLNYDSFCQNPAEGLILLSDFLAVEVDRSKLAQLELLVKPPASIGRYKQHKLNSISPEDRALLEELGYSYEPKKH